MDVDWYFKDTPEGRAFFPYGVVTRGYLVDSEAEQSARRFIGVWHTGSLASLFIGFVVLGYIDPKITPPLFLAAWGVLALLSYVIGIARVTSGCRRAKEWLTWAEMARLQGKSYSLAYIVFLLISSVVFVCGSALVVILSIRRPGEITAIGAVGFLFFGYCFYRFAVIARARYEPD